MGHLAHHVSDLVDSLELSTFYAPYKGDGRRNSPYDPSMMVPIAHRGQSSPSHRCEQHPKLVCPPLRALGAVRWMLTDFETAPDFKSGHRAT